ncbi:MAG TPA: DUF3800 domain-containing protein [Sphingomicrobium sp.]|jgi:hypothetical protein|nr:DUF3800 domain-containing protein [Sphingomicrobium sp.]
MRLIYTDEAGTSENEPVVVVAAVVVKEGEEVALIDSELSRIIAEKVPEHFRDGFYIHATDIFQGAKRLRDGWSILDRMDFLKEVASLPFVHDIPIAISYATKNDFSAMLKAGWKPGKPKFTSNQYNHFLMFGLCMDMADLFLRKYLKGAEKGRVIAESLSEMQSIFQRNGLLLRDIKIEGPADGQVRDIAHQRMGTEPTDFTHHIENIVDQPKFFSKGEQSILQIADVIAFSFRRFASKQKHGDELVEAILGPFEGPATTNDEAWFAASNLGLFNTEKFLGPEALAQHQFRISVALGNTMIMDGFDPDWERHLNEDRARAERIEVQWGEYGVPRIPQWPPLGRPFAVPVINSDHPVALSSSSVWPAAPR